MSETRSTPAASQEHESRPQPPHKLPIALLVGLLMLRTVLLLVGDGISYGIARAFDPGATLAGVLLYTNVFVVAVDIITLAVLVAALRREGMTLRSLIGRFRLSDLTWGALLFVIVAIGFVITTYIGNLIVYQGPPPIDASSSPHVPLSIALWSIVVLPVTVAIAEELLYRAYLQPRLITRLGLWPGLLIPAVFFGLQHVAFSLTSPQAAGARVITMTLVGLMLGALYLWRKRVGQLIIAHWLIDVVALGLPLLLIAS
jgi:membrane protease YdiL (CAAX protease family)